MNWKQLICLWLGILSGVFVLLYVPYNYTENSVFKDYYYFWDGPVEVNNNIFDGAKSEYEVGTRMLSKAPRYFQFSIDFGKICIELGVIFLITTGLLISFSNRKK
jgi:hypothetical protein